MVNIIGTGVFYTEGSRGYRIFIGTIDIIIGLIFVTNMTKSAFWLGAFFCILVLSRKFW